MTSVEQLVFGVGGLGLLAVWVWSWRGKSYTARWWTRSLNGDLAALVLIPAGGFLLASATANSWGAPWWVTTPLAMGVVVCGFWGFMVTALSWFWWPARRAWGPGWYTRQPKDAAWKTESGGDELTRAKRHRPTWAGSEVAYWKGTQIRDGDNPSRNDAMKGHLWVSDGGVWFNPLFTLDSSMKTVAVRWTDIHDARVVAGNEDGNSRTIAGLMHRSLMPRLVLATTDGNRMFEIVGRRAAAAAKVILEEKEGRA